MPVIAMVIQNVSSKVDAFRDGAGYDRDIPAMTKALWNSQ